jgi:predicted TIM-barrel fold metal-dependent hydrolase
MEEVPNSTGTARPRHAAPPDACDAHLHIYDPRLPMAFPHSRATPNATAADYRRLQARIGTRRAIVVQPAAYGTDNRVTVAAIEQLGRANARGIAVVHPDVGDDELAALDKAGVRGLRFTQHDPATAVTTPAMIEPLAHRIHELGWHTQLHMRGEQLLAIAAVVERLPGTIVIDHMGRVPQPEGTRHSSFKLVRRLLERGRAWVKLSGAYLDTKIGSPAYDDVSKVAREYVRIAPDRLVWGSDWPHPTERDAKPDDGVLFDLLHDWCGDEATFRRILAENPAALYGF